MTKAVSLASAFFIRQFGLPWSLVGHCSLALPPEEVEGEVSVLNNQATVHVTDIANKRKRELHLCEKCARKHNLIPDQPTPHVDLKALLGLLIGPLQQQHQASATADPVALTCPSCGLQYVEFRAEGRLGCPDDYEAFRATLEPLLE